MKGKKIFMIYLLVVFLLIIGVIIAKINDKSKAVQNSKVQDTTIASTNTDTTTTTNIIESLPSIPEGMSIRKGLENANFEINENEVTEITDNFFIEQTNDIYYNLDDYIGKTIKLEGLIYYYEDYLKEDICYAVVRNTPGCCGSDGLAGLDIRYNGDYPKANTWVEVIGALNIDTVNGMEIPALQVFSMQEKEKGKTFVNN